MPYWLAYGEEESQARMKMLEVHNSPTVNKSEANTTFVWKIHEQQDFVCGKWVEHSFRRRDDWHLKVKRHSYDSDVCKVQLL